MHAAELVSEKKADNIVVLDISKLASYAGFLVVCSAPSSRQVHAIARHLYEDMGCRAGLQQWHPRAAGQRPSQLLRGADAGTVE